MSSKIRKAAALVISISVIIFLVSACSTSKSVQRNNYGQTVLNKNAKDLKLIELPLMRQATDYTCGVACVQSILWYAGIDYREDELAKALKSTEKDGTSLKAIMKFFKEKGYNEESQYFTNKNYSNTIKASFKENMSYDDLEGFIDKKEPVICLIQAWNGDSDYDYSKDWEDGHYVIAIGYDKDSIYFMDPSTPGNYTYISREKFKSRWHDYDSDGKYVHAGIVISVKDAEYDPEQVLSLN